MERIRDISQYSKSTLNVQKSTNKWVEKFINILKDEGEMALSAEIAKTNFSVGYLNSIIRTMELRILQQNLNLRIPEKIKNLRKRKRINKKRHHQYHETLKNVVFFALKQISQIHQNKLSNGELITRSTLEAYVMIILVFMTALRSNEVTQLTIHDLYKIKNQMPIFIRIKKRQKPIVIGIMQDMFNLIYPTIIYILAEAYSQILPNANISARFMTQQDKDTFLLMPHTSPIADNILFSCHKSTLNKEIKNIYQKVNEGKFKGESVGVQGIRSLVLTELISIGDPQIAQLFTRHQNSKTTTTFYNNPDPVEGFDLIAGAGGFDE